MTPFLQSRPASIASLAILVIAALALIGCSEERVPAAVGEVRHELFTDYSENNQLALGHAVFVKHCVGCHGVEGDGKGDAARWLDPKPRNFQLALFRFTSTPAGSLPTDDDLMRTLEHGLKGSAMPAFPLVPAAERRAVIAYIKSFSKRWTEDAPKSPVPIGEDPYHDDPVTGILDGEYLYHTVATCWQCHPGYVGLDLLNQFNRDAERPELPELPAEFLHSKQKTTSDGELIMPPDFTYDYVKTGTSSDTLFHRIGAGITGAAMPAWAYALKAADIWAIAYYVQYLAQEQRSDTLRGPHAPFGERHPEGVYPILLPEEAAAAKK